MWTKKAFVMLAVASLLLGGCSKEAMHAFFYGTDEEWKAADKWAGGMTQIDPPMIDVETPPPPISDAQVVMRNSKGEVVFEGVTNKMGNAEGTTGPGQMDHELYIEVTTPDGTTLNRKFSMGPGQTLVSIKVHKETGEFIPEWETRAEPSGGDRRDEGAGGSMY